MCGVTFAHFWLGSVPQPICLVVICPPTFKRKSHIVVGERGEKGVQVLSVLATHLPIQLAERYGEKMCFVKYHVSEEESSVVRMTGGVQTLRNVSAYKEPTWHFDAQFIDKQGHAKAIV